jgi:hypothetical protein
MSLAFRDLHQDSSEFAHFWDAHAVLGREGGERRFNHPTKGALRFNQVTFNLSGRADFRLTMLVGVTP